MLVYLDSTEILSEIWDSIVEHIEGRWSRWKWLVPKMSSRGQTLVINNLVTSSLWPKLTCGSPTKPASKHLSRARGPLQHWILQCVLHLPKEEWGPALVQLASRTTAFNSTSSETPQRRGIQYGEQPMDCHVIHSGRTGVIQNLLDYLYLTVDF